VDCLWRSAPLRTTTKVIQLLDRLLTALRDGETIVFYGDASSPSGATMMRLADPGDWGTLIATDFSGIDRSRRARSMAKPDTTTTTTTNDTTNDTTEPLWMASRSGGDVLLRWEDLTDAEQQDAIRHHNQLYGVAA
jgi:hypothetical protein